MRKIKVINAQGEEIKVNVFTRADLIEKLGLSEDNAKVIMKYQRAFPELLQERKGFIIDARTLWEQLDKPYSEFKKWFNKKVLNYGYLKNTDFINIEQKVDIENTNITRSQNEFYLTIECAKNVAMAERTEKGRLVRDYFILIEKALRGMDDWFLIREPEKEGFKELCKQLDIKYQENHGGKKTPGYIYSNEADMINKCLLGRKAKQIKNFLGYADNETREHLNTEVNKAIYELQILDSSLIVADVDAEQRELIVSKTCDTKYRSLKIKVEEEFSKVA